MNIIKLPQLIDPHVHFRTPGMEHKEDWHTASQAALAGGITTVLDMPNVKPPTTTAELLTNKINLIDSSTLINYGLHFGAASDNLKEIPKVLNKVASVKVFLNHSTGSLLIEDDKILEQIFRSSSLITVHAEDEMIEKAIWLTKKCGNQLYFCHMYCKDGIDLIKKHKKSLPIFVEVTPHHLFLTNDKSDDPFYRMLPPLQTKADTESLWEAITDGTIDTIGTDHAPHTIEEKNSDTPPFGIPGIETALPLMLNAVNKDRITIKRLTELMSTNVAKIFNIPLNPETYTEVDMDMKKEVNNSELQTKCSWSPFDGWQLQGWPIKVAIDSQIVMENNIIDNNHKGKYIYGQTNS